jgi:NHL repeat/WD40-like Beta Propeller Repeat
LSRGFRRSRGAGVFACAVVCAAVVLLGVFSVPAFALQAHVFSSSFGSTGSGNGQFSSPSGVAVDQSSGDVYVADSGNNRIEKFSPSGAFIAAFGTAGAGNGQLSDPTEIAVDNSVSPVAVYVVDSANNRVEKFSAAGAYLSQIDGTSGASAFGQLYGVAVGVTGDVWVYQASAEIDEFDSTGAFLTSFPCPCGTSPGFGVDSQSNVYANRGAEVFEKISGLGTDIGTVDGSGTDTAIAVAGDDELYIDQGTSIAHYPASCDPSAGICTPSDTFAASGTGSIAQGQGVAVNDASGVVYVADAGDNTVKLFSAATVPDATTGPASSVTPTTATVSGTVNPQGVSASYQFEYGTDSSYGSLAPATAAVAGSDSADHVETAALTGLSPSTTYHFRIDTSNVNGSNDGADQTFRTSGPPQIDSGQVQSAGRTVAAVAGSINPDGFDTTYQIDYGTSTSYGSSSTPVDIGSGLVDQATSDNLTGLSPGTTYHYRVTAQNSQGIVHSADQTFTTQPIAGVSLSVSDVTATSATLRAQLNPLGTDSNYHFDYGASAANGSSVPAPDGGIGSGSDDVPVSQHLSELAPNTVYHYRVTVSNSFGTLHSADHTFTTQPLASPFKLPDNRGYELVTPSAKGDGSLPSIGTVSTPFSVQAAADGDKLGYLSLTPLDGAQQGGFGHFLASRGSDGWSSQALDPPQAPTNSVAQIPVINGYSSDLSKAILADGGGAETGGLSQDSPPLVSGEPANNANLFLRKNSSSSYQLLNITPSSATPDTATFLNATPDLSHVFFQSPSVLTAGAVSGAPNLYEWFDDRVSLVDQVPIPPATVCGRGAAPCSAFPDGATLGMLNDNTSNEENVSNDGSMVFFGEGAFFNAGSAHYVREDGDRTVDFAASQKTNGSGPGGADPGGPQRVQFWLASANGARVFFSSAEKLTNDATAGGGQDLYQYDTGSGVLADLTVDHGDPSGALLQGVLGASADGSYVYFVADGVLASGASPGPNLYVAHNGVKTFIASLSSSDSSEWSGDFTPRVTPDGTHLAFSSVGSVTGFDSDGFNEVYLYDATDDRLVCASCNTTGARPIGSASLPGFERGTTGAPDAYPYRPRSLSSDGRRLFFRSFDAVTPGDVNGRQDVYEYEDGQTHLISSGTSDSDSTFVDASASGDDVFINTSSQLVGQDVDQRPDIYDVRVGGGFPFTQAAPSCAGDACKARPAVGGSDQALGSASFFGPGDPALVSPAPATKPKALTRAQKLAKALKECKRELNRQRASCTARAKRLYGRRKAAKKAVGKRAAKRSSTRNGRRVSR